MFSHPNGGLHDKGDSDESQADAFRERIEQAKELLPLYEFIRDLDDADEVDQGLWPFHDDHSPSFSLFTQDDVDLWKCHAGCGAGDQINYLEIKFDLTRGEAIHMFLEMAGLSDVDGGGKFNL